MKPLTAESPGVTVELLCEAEDFSYEGNASAIDEDTDRETETWIRDQLAAGNEWAWCCAHVRVTYEVALAGKAFPATIKGNAYLGGCSYESEADFRAHNYADMLAEALDDLNARREALCADAS